MRRLSALAALVVLAVLAAAAPALAGSPPPPSPASKSIKPPAPAAPGAVPTKTQPGATTTMPPPPPGPPGSQPLRPNLYELKSGTLSVSYSTSGIDGKAHLSYHDSGVDASFAGADIRSQETEVGTLVTVTIRRTVDSGSTAFSLLVPLVNMESASSVVSVNVVGITTVHRFSPVPIMNRGQVQLGSPVVLNGTAKRVAF